MEVLELRIDATKTPLLTYDPVPAHKLHVAHARALVKQETRSSPVPVVGN